MASATARVEEMMGILTDPTSSEGGATTDELAASARVRLRLSANGRAICRQQPQVASGVASTWP